jgi:protein tyrosine/serine phosphatase
MSTLSSDNAKVEAFGIAHNLRRGISQETRLWSAPFESTSVKPMEGQQSDHEQPSFLERTREISKNRNLKLEKVLNARDLATCHNSLIQPGKVFRTGKISDANDEDVKLLMEDLGIKTLIDLRSGVELKDDPNLGAPVYQGFTNVLWKDRGRKREGCVRVLKANESPVKERFWKRSKRKMLLVEDMIMGKETHESDDCEDCGSMGGVDASNYKGQRKERLFVPLMNEFKYVKGTVSKVRKRDLMGVLVRAPGSVVSKRVRQALKKPFLNKINGGGLTLLNEILLRYGAPGIRYVLEVVADESRHPVAFYCTAGKDRTGAIAATILELCGVESESIVEDYSLSATAYSDLDDGNALVGALSQRDLDPEVFLGAPPEVMREVLHDLAEQYGSVSAYATWIGFGPEKQQKLREALLKTNQKEEALVRFR